MKIIIDNKIPYIKRGCPDKANNCRNNLRPGKDFTRTGTRRRCADYPDPYSLQSGITGRQPGKVYSYSKL